MIKNNSFQNINSFIFLTLIVAGTYFNSIWNSFALDDIVHIVNNIKIRANLPVLPLFIEPVFPGNLYRPLVQASYALTHQLFGINPLIFHLINIFSHLACSILVFKLSSKLFNLKIGLVSSILFAVLPIHSEAVSNISGRYELWSSMFGLSALTLFIYLRTDKFSVVNFFFLLFLYLFSLLSKENTITILPITILCWLYLKKPFNSLFLKNYSALLFSLFIYLALRAYALPAGIVSINETSFIDNPLVNLNLLERIVNSVYLLGKYLSLSVLPFQLCADYSFNQIPLVNSNHTYINLAVVFGTFVILSLALVLFAFKRENLSFCILWFFSAFAVTSNVFFPIGTIFGERLAYFPSVGICILLAVLISKATPQMSVLVTALLMLFYISIIIPRNSEWKDDATLHSAQIYISPNSTKTQSNYGMLLIERNRSRESLGYFDNALAITPDDATALLGKALAFQDMNDFESSEKVFNKIFSLTSNHKPSLLAYVRLKLKVNDPAVAEEYMNKVIKNYGEDQEVLVHELALFILQKNEIKANNLKNFMLHYFPDSPKLSPLIEEGFRNGVFK